MRQMILALAAVATLSAPAAAEGWQFSLTPYLMFPNMDGKGGVGPLDVDVSASPADIFSNLNWGAMAIAEINNGQWGFAIDATYMNLDGTRDRGLAEITGHQGAYTGMVLRRIDKYAELYVGARVNDLGISLEGTGPLGNPRSASAGKTWVDPLVGVRATLPISSRMDLTVLADFGGFGIGSDYAVQAWPALGWKFSERSKAMLGYRLIYVKYESGEGLERFVYDVATFGPTIGFQFQF